MNKQIQALLLFLSICSVGTIMAQNTRVDSLENILKIHTAEDTVKVNLLNKIAFTVYIKDIVKSRSYAAQAGELSDKLKYQKGKAESLWVIGLSYNKPDNLMAIAYFQKALKTAKEINDKTGIIKYLTSLGNNYKTQNQDSSAIRSFREAMEISEGENDRLGMAKSLMNLSHIYFREGKYAKSAEGYQKALKHFEDLNEKVSAATCLNNLGAMYAVQGNYPVALECFQKRLKVNEEQSDTSGVIASLTSIGNICTSQNDYPKALDYYQRALKKAEEINDKQQISACYSSIGNIYMKTNNSEALDYFQKALTISEKGPDASLTISIIYNIGVFYLDYADFEKAMVYFSKALEQAEKAGMKLTICSTLTKIGTVYLRKKNYAKALSYTLKSLPIANEMKLKVNQKNIHHQLSEIYAATNDYRNAYLHHQRYTGINDSVYNEKNVKKIAELENTYKFEKEKQAIESGQQKKDAVQLAEKKEQNIIMLSLIAGFILMFVLAGIVSLSYRIKRNTNILLTRQKQEIEGLNEEYLVVNEELSASNEELQKINTEKDKFFSIIAHDLRGPFNGFLGLTQLMAEDLHSLTMPEIQEIAASMKKSATNLFRLLENLLHWARMKQGLIPFKKEIVALLPVVTESVEMIKESARNKRIEITSDIPGHLVVLADSNMLQTVIRNLVSNAVKFTLKGGKIYILAKAMADKSVEISVRDSGIGMSRTMLDHLFRLDVKTNRTGTDGEPSTGLGLLLCKEFVEKHGGTLRVESEEGKGSTFYFTIPYESGWEGDKIINPIVFAEKTENLITSEVSGLKILIAEDDGMSERIITKAVKMFSKEILNVRTGAEAIASCRSNPDIDLVLMDLEMPGMDGYEATRQIRQFNSDVVIIAQTAHSSIGDTDKTLAAGCNDSITKPVKKDQLLELIQKYFKN